MPKGRNTLRANSPWQTHYHGRMSEKTITLGGGCFWCVEAVFVRMKGITDVESGYANGHIDHPTYEQVCTGETGHAEVVRLRYDSTQLSLSDILQVFFAVHDPTTLNCQGNDVGTQYRSGIYVSSDAQRAAAEASLKSFGAALGAKGFPAITTDNHVLVLFNKVATPPVADSQITPFWHFGWNATDERAKVKELAVRDYPSGSAGSLECVLLFIPNEQLYAFVQEHASSILDEAMQHPGRGDGRQLH